MKTHIKNVALVIFTVLIFLLMPATAIAEDDGTTYSFASAQGSTQLEVIPGTNTYGTIYFYNVDGNVITHVAFETVDAPAGWTVSFDPALHEAQYSLGGPPITVEENLFAAPTELFTEPVDNPPAGTIALTLPNKLGPDVPGYCVAKELEVVISVPASVATGITDTVTVKATGFWLGQGGAAAITQERQFDFNVNTVYELTEERPITPFDWNRWLPVILAGGIGVAVLGIIYVPKLIAKRRKSA